MERKKEKELGDWQYRIFDDAFKEWQGNDKKGSLQDFEQEAIIKQISKDVSSREDIYNWKTKLQNSNYLSEFALKLQDDAIQENHIADGAVTHQTAPLFYHLKKAGKIAVNAISEQKISNEFGRDKDKVIAALNSDTEKRFKDAMKSITEGQEYQKRQIEGIKNRVRYIEQHKNASEDLKEKLKEFTSELGGLTSEKLEEVVGYLETIESHIKKYEAMKSEKFDDPSINSLKELTDKVIEAGKKAQEALDLAKEKQAKEDAIDGIKRIVGFVIKENKKLENSNKNLDNKLKEIFGFSAGKTSEITHMNGQELKNMNLDQLKEVIQDLKNMNITYSSYILKDDWKYVEFDNNNLQGIVEKIKEEIKKKQEKEKTKQGQAREDYKNLSYGEQIEKMLQFLESLEEASKNNTSMPEAQPYPLTEQLEDATILVYDEFAKGKNENDITDRFKDLLPEMQHKNELTDFLGFLQNGTEYLNVFSYDSFKTRIIAAFIDSWASPLYHPSQAGQKVKDLISTYRDILKRLVPVSVPVPSGGGGGGGADDAAKKISKTPAKKKKQASAKKRSNTSEKKKQKLAAAELILVGKRKLRKAKISENKKGIVGKQQPG